MPYSVLLALGSNLGDRARHLRRAVDELRNVIAVVRLSPIHETAAVDAPAGSPPFLNMVLAGHTALAPEVLLARLMAIEQRAGRRRGVRNAPRTLDLDLILHSAHLLRTPQLTLPHPRYLQREFVRRPLRELALGWVDPRTGVVI
jgi:2-amino-4-hydroxy-6-hydroxymethyldihydropteridine diphosphokinase